MSSHERGGRKSTEVRKAGKVICSIQNDLVYVYLMNEDEIDKV